MPSQKQRAGRASAFVSPVLDGPRCGNCGRQTMRRFTGWWCKWCRVFHDPYRPSTRSL